MGPAYIHSQGLPKHDAVLHCLRGPSARTNVGCSVDAKSSIYHRMTLWRTCNAGASGARLRYLRVVYASRRAYEAKARLRSAKVTLQLSGHSGFERGNRAAITFDHARAYHILFVPSARFPSQANTRAVAVCSFLPQRRLSYHWPEEDASRFLGITALYEWSI